jgi:hypothetical protein
MTPGELYQNYLEMTTHLPGERMTYDEYVAARKFAQGVIAETDAARILEIESMKITRYELTSAAIREMGAGELEEIEGLIKEQWARIELEGK